MARRVLLSRDEELPLTQFMKGISIPVLWLLNSGSAKELELVPAADAKERWTRREMLSGGLWVHRNYPSLRLAVAPAESLQPQVLYGQSEGCFPKPVKSVSVHARLLAEKLQAIRKAQLQSPVSAPLKVTEDHFWGP